MIGRPRPRPHVPGAHAGREVSPKPCAESHVLSKALNRAEGLHSELLQRLFREARGLTENELYERLAAWEDNSDASGLQQRKQTESTLRGEVFRLQKEVSQLRDEAYAAKKKAMDAELAQVKTTEKIEARMSLSRRQLQSIARAGKRSYQKALRQAEKNGSAFYRGPGKSCSPCRRFPVAIWREGSRHYPLLGGLAHSRRYSAQPVKNYDQSAMEFCFRMDPDSLNSYARIVDDALEGAEPSWALLRQTMEQALQSEFPKKRNGHHRYTEGLWTYRRTLRSLPEVLLALADLHKQLKQRLVWRTWAAVASQSAAARHAKRRKFEQRQQLIDEQLAQAEAKSSKDGSHSLYKVIRSFKTGKPNERVQLRDEQGRFLTMQEERQALEDYSRDLFGTGDDFQLKGPEALQHIAQLLNRETQVTQFGFVPGAQCDIAALQKILTMYADDTLLQMHFDDKAQLQEALQLCDLLLDQLTELGFKVNPEKSALLLQIHGGSAQQTRQGLITTKQGKKFVQLPSGRLIALKSQVAYLGIILSYQDYEMKSLRHRLQASKAALKEVAHAVRNSRAVTEKRRLSIWRITAWASAMYGLHVVGLTPQGLSQLESHMIFQLRFVLRSYSQETHETNQQFVQRNGLKAAKLLVLKSMPQAQQQRLDLTPRAYEAYRASQLARITPEHHVLASVTRGWTFDGNQHDSAEFLSAILLNLPGIQVCSWETRSPMAEGYVVDEEGLSPIFLAAPLADNLQAMINQWSNQTPVHALITAERYALLALPRYVGESKNSSPIRLQETLSLPVFEAEGSALTWHSFILRAGVIHLGEETTSGHYRSLIRTEAQWFLADDSRPPTACNLNDPMITGNVYLLLLELQLACLCRYFEEELPSSNSSMTNSLCRYFEEAFELGPRSETQQATQETHWQASAEFTTSGGALDGFRRRQVDNAIKAINSFVAYKVLKKLRPWQPSQKAQLKVLSAYCQERNSDQTLEAFDTVSCQDILDQLQDLSVDPSLISLVHGLHHSSKYRLHAQGSFAEVETTTGVKQGCKLAPTLFSVLTGRLLHLLIDTFGLEAVQQHLTGYADDISVHKTIRSRRDLKLVHAMIQALLDAVGRLRLRVNPVKCSIMVKLSGTAAPSVMRRHTCWLPDASGELKKHWRLGPNKTYPAFRQEGQIKYLGMMISYANFEMLMLRHRLAEANKKIQQVRRYIYNRCIASPAARLRAWFATVWATAVTGIPEVGLTPESARHLGGWYASKIRSVLNQPAHVTHVTTADLFAHHKLKEGAASDVTLHSHILIDLDRRYANLQRKFAQHQALIDEQLRQAEIKSATDGSHSLYKVIKTFKRGHRGLKMRGRKDLQSNISTCAWSVERSLLAQEAHQETGSMTELDQVHAEVKQESLRDPALAASVDAPGRWGCKLLSLSDMEPKRVSQLAHLTPEHPSLEPATRGAVALPFFAGADSTIARVPFRLRRKSLRGSKGPSTTKADGVMVLLSPEVPANTVRWKEHLKGGMGAASGLAERCRDLQHRAAVLNLELDSLKKGARQKRQAMEECSRDARDLAQRLELAEKDQPGSTLLVEAEAADLHSDFKAEVVSLLTERSELRESLQKQKEMAELQQLLADERMLLEKRRMSAADMLREIADLEEQADDLERNSQRVLGEMRNSLERLAMQVEELRRAKDQAEDWLGAVWAALNQQRREQLLLHQRVKEEDDWAGRLQDRTESLVVELQVLEKETQAQQRIPQTAEKETFRSLALLQQSRKDARQALSRQLARGRQVQGSLKEAETQQISLLEDLRPVRLGRFSQL
ncbi:hypothetical protein AK812_SmicGene30586 [Symbiodinium microadriaticum]|uniref:Reverse transcriptase domain-containing protein n=1 Tax=Symbiodinium microadriaticum TaxID=2951 RepID=A0A1Q9CYU9_SYMMI|nr:hypothetical protein AK812_SmicGene30586 [Symbiodinium microadriaticum]